MREILYIDDYFLLNFLMDLTAVLFTSRILSEKIKGVRLFAAALLGGLWSVIPLLFSFPAWGQILFAALGLPLLPLTAFSFRGKRRFGFSVLFFFAGSLFLGGAVEAVYFFTARFTEKRKITFLVFAFLIALSATFWELWGKGMKRRMETGVVSFTFSRKERKMSLYGLVDSGSLLKEPISGDPVVIVKASQAAPLFGAEELQRAASGTLPGFLAIPMKTAAGTRILFGFRPEKAALHHRTFRKEHKEVKCVVALDFSEGAFAGCPALIPLSLI